MARIGRRMAKNPYLNSFVEGLKSRYPIDGAQMSASEWIQANTKLAGKPFRFKDYEFQKQIVDDYHPDLCVKKPSQVGLTEVQVRKFLAFLARNRGTSGIFTFPSEKMFKSNSKTRIKPVVTQPAFSMTTLDDEKPNRAMNLYEVNGSFAHIFGMTEGEATSTPADILFQDELDLSDQAMVALFKSRLQNSVWKITQKFSTPTFPLFGIDAEFNASDQMQYMVKCECCGHWQTPDFELSFVCLPGYDGDGNIDEITTDQLERIQLDATYVKCEACSRPLNLHRPELREWVPKYPTRDARGYEVLPFSTWKLTPAYIIRQQQKYRQLETSRATSTPCVGRPTPTATASWSRMW